MLRNESTLSPRGTQLTPPPREAQDEVVSTARDLTKIDLKLAVFTSLEANVIFCSSNLLSENLFVQQHFELHGRRSGNVSNIPPGEWLTHSER